MKTRTGFVSNSSSTSFIVLLPRKPKNAIELAGWLFPNYKLSEKITYEYSEELFLTIEQIAERVYNDIIRGQKDRSNSFEDATGGYIQEIDEDSMVSLFRKSYDEANEKHSKVYRELREKYDKDDRLSFEKMIKFFEKDERYPEYVKTKREEIKTEKRFYRERQKEVKKWYKKFRGDYKYHRLCVILEYGDRHGECILEHEGIFRNVPHLSISNH